MSNKRLAKETSFDGDLNDFKDHSDRNMVVYESWLNKKGKVNTDMKERYCVAYTDRKLAYYAQPNDKQPKGFVDLSTVNTINMYLPQSLDTQNEQKKKPKNSDKKKSKHQQASSMDAFLDEMKSLDLDLSAIKMQRQRSISLNVKDCSLKGVGNDYAFELVTGKRVWIFSSDDIVVFQQWMRILQDLCFGKKTASGWLRKIGGRSRTWNRRWFVLYDVNEMRYFTNTKLEEQKGKIELNKVKKVCLTKPKQYHYTFCLELHTDERVWVLAAESAQEREKWQKEIRASMAQHRKKFVPSSTGFLSFYHTASGYWRKYFVAVHKHKTSNRLCLFEQQIHCKQLEALTCFGDHEFDIMCKTKIQQIISLEALKDCLQIDRFEFKMVNECKSNMDDLRFIFTAKLADSQHYFAPHPNTHENTQEWVNIIKNLKSSERQRIYKKLVKLGYKPNYVAAAIEQYEEAYGTKKYDYKEIKEMIDRMAKPESGAASAVNTQRAYPYHAKSSSHSKSKSTSSPLVSPVANITNLPMQPLREDRSHSLPLNTVVDPDNYQLWTVNDVMFWVRSLENGVIASAYPNVLKAMNQMNVTGQKLKAMNRMNFEQMGVHDEYHLAVIMDALSRLQ